mmetsp:Transcript_3644/g.9360  ORF Transcript_3644/g.9360 Transcript_3644/m.9360 type:complete len:141 (+) Transcript_3644:50-472(+)|eukprot:CAMPEP_0197413526 /NCGR_PEP_ID=MMETSP1170-20131217/379_1 /TAXON_ID=54406 /ORGANISM="Sarcinochrysis sp, Strain CCMP770" /LENGTH=140 /DNA_ID=CAMNT_0042940115 /DNA_START=50 /DNA_END=472 /DNA_ORIENTATION=-
MMRALACLSCLTAVAAFSVQPSPCSRRPLASPPTTRVEPLNAVIPGNSMAELVVLGGTANFFGIYNVVLTARILLSWFPQAMNIPILQPIFIVTEPFLGLFRGLIPPLFGIDFSLIPALLLLNAASNSVMALGADMSLIQ